MIGKTSYPWFKGSIVLHCWQSWYPNSKMGGLTVSHIDDALDYCACYQKIKWLIVLCINTIGNQLYFLNHFVQGISPCSQVSYTYFSNQWSFCSYMNPDVSTKFDVMLLSDKPRQNKVGIFCMNGKSIDTIWYEGMECPLVRRQMWLG